MWVVLMKLFHYSLAIVLFCLSVNWGLLAQNPAKKNQSQLPQGVEVLKDIEYAKHAGISLKLDLYLPEEIKGNVPVIVYVHGGGWKNGSKSSGKRGAWIVPHGFALVCINYRLTDSGQWPDQINDCYEAVRWVRKNSKRYGLNAERIGCWGTSAGAHLAALMGTRTYPGRERVSSRVQATADWFGPSELLTMPPNNVGNGRTEEDVAKSNGAKLLGATVKDVPEIAKDASALDNVSKDDSPFLIMHGTADPGVPIIQSEKLHAALTAVGVPSTFVQLKGAKHGGPEFLTPESNKIFLEFFTQHLKPAN
jgi:acetyl esterase/lipase